MANKKLKVEVELETAKAKRQLGNMAETGGGASGPSPVDDAAKRTAQAMERAAKSTEDFGEKATKSGANINHLVRSFAGLGAGMAMNYAAQFVPEGKARETVEVGAAGMKGFAMASMIADAIPVIGGLAKLAIKGGGAAFAMYNEKEKQDKLNKKTAQEFEKSEELYKQSEAFADMLRSLTAVKDGANDFSAKLAQANGELDRRKGEEEELTKKIRKAIEDRKYEEAVSLQQSLSRNRGEQGALKNAIRSLEMQSDAADKKNDKKENNRLSTPVDAITRIGGSMFGDYGLGRNEEQLRILREQEETLRSIDRKTGEKSVWQ